MSQDVLNPLVCDLVTELQTLQLYKDKLEKELLETKNQLVAELVSTKAQILADLNWTLTGVSRFQDDSPDPLDIHRDPAKLGIDATQDQKPVHDEAPEDSDGDQCAQENFLFQPPAGVDGQDIVHIHRTEKVKARRSGPSLKRKTISLGKKGKVFSAVVYYDPTSCEMEAAMYLPAGQALPDLKDLVKALSYSLSELLMVDQFEKLVGGHVSASSQPRTLQTKDPAKSSAQRRKHLTRAATKVLQSQPRLQESYEREQQLDNLSSLESSTSTSSRPNILGNETSVTCLSRHAPPMLQPTGEARSTDSANVSGPIGSELQQGGSEYMEIQQTNLSITQILSSKWQGDTCFFLVRREAIGLGQCDVYENWEEEKNVRSKDEELVEAYWDDV
ncbi:hypothetical protein TruAng_011418 [Truncatella angustata]|nr:hypothetical protein TruAng_011418 [Truncatella angustata]